MEDSPSLSYSILTLTPCLLDVVCQVHSLKSTLNTLNECLIWVLEFHSRLVSISQRKDMTPSMHKVLKNLKLWTDVLQELDKVLVVIQDLLLLLL